MTQETKQKHLGRGLAALLGEDSVVVGRGAATAGSGDKGVGAATGLKMVGVERLHPSNLQPRRHFTEEALAALAASIKEQGVLQPIVVRPLDGSPADRAHAAYEIIAGERRWRAAQRAGISEIPVVVRTLTDEEALQVALIENLQREDLNALEEAQAYQRLMDEFSYTQQAVAKSVSRSRSHIANTVRLLGLPPSVQTMIQDGRLSAGHARTLVTSDYPEVLAQQIINRHLSVRDAEALVQAQKSEKAEVSGARQGISAEKSDPNIRALEAELAAALGLKVQIKVKKSGGILSLTYQDVDQLEDVLAKLKA